MSQDFSIVSTRKHAIRRLLPASRASPHAHMAASCIGADQGCWLRSDRRHCSAARHAQARPFDTYCMQQKEPTYICRFNMFTARYTDAHLVEFLRVTTVDSGHRPSTALDKAAQDRGTSIYLVDRVIPMLPRMLCEELCSLTAGVDHLTFSIGWHLDGVSHCRDPAVLWLSYARCLSSAVSLAGAGIVLDRCALQPLGFRTVSGCDTEHIAQDGNVLYSWASPSVIRSCAKLRYSDAQKVLEDDALPQPSDVSIHGDHAWQSVR